MNNLSWIKLSKSAHEEIQIPPVFDSPRQKTRPLLFKQEQYPYIETIQKIMHAAGDVARPPLEHALLVHQALNFLRDRIFELDLLKAVQAQEQTRVLKAFIKHIFKRQDQSFNEFEDLKASVFSSMQGKGLEALKKKRKVQRNFTDFRKIDEMDIQSYHYFVHCRGTSFLSQGILTFKRFIQFDEWKPFLKIQRLYKFLQFISFCFVKVVQQIV